ncbi:uncharacterized protein LOC131059727 isoform X1 [Cryptomeria japonica]|uniref:uncharacterized protein LOC131059727 isoform X1 n=2 Tax=Cryptomeria japonica TaxID=3369 RepID=UPI0025AB79E0|nr:uncharacterized protein LOC131059727 isoform X1 [Cryptomeria japonica]XP_057848737.1 uncharacterized protein LOC131059727 isoform X1 [Cryptomeria japonica]XP_057848738.1 uncharacterized protein LOC131059727 isoform X1 [Cryptomeria japonica]XP_057848739.1 uncharacterized protein LOC131059727 isoform X1 [Cryptomeria japonica]XP_057848740.1 uncharacterized protein LOC131059727 isoform X1 [Cryptomeria japonica]
MFKKASDVKALQRLSGADRKKLRRNIHERLPFASDADFDVILPPKAEITITKLTNRVHVYAVEGGPPMIFDVDGRGADIFPTVYALWKVPTLLPSFVLKGGEVSRYIIGGADLMFPGIGIPPEGLPSFSVGEAWSVKVPGNAYPIAVGATYMSSAEASKAGLRGKALRITHYYRDTLWESAEGRYIPNEGFLEDIVVEDPAHFAASQTTETPESKALNSLEHIQQGSGNGGDVYVQDGAELDPDDETKVQPNDKNEPSEQVAKDLEELKVADNIEEEASSGKGQSASMTVEEVDTLLDKCLLQALHTTVKDKDLPMPGSTLWSNHILACRPPGITLDIKKSSHKKLSKWLQAKSSHGLISAKEDKHRKEVMLLAVNRGNPDYQAFKPEKKKAVLTEAPDTTQSDVARSQMQLEVIELWKSTTHVNSILEAVGANPNQFYTALEATDIVFSYVEKEKLVKPDNKSMIVLNATLCDALYKGTVKKGSMYPTEIHKKDLGPMFLSRMQSNHRVTRGNESVVRKGGLKTIQIMTERRQGNKKVTKVSGIESFLIDADALASELQKKFACSTSVAELPGKKGQNEVLVQGGVLEDLARHLVQQYGIPKKYIEVLDKTKK